jgi:hypothetical protein
MRAIRLSSTLPEQRTNDGHRTSLYLGQALIPAEGRRPAEFTAVPYYAWQNRGIDEMTVWIIEGPTVALAGSGGEGPSEKPDPSNLRLVPIRRHAPSG